MFSFVTKWHVTPVAWPVERDQPVNINNSWRQVCAWIYDKQGRCIHNKQSSFPKSNPSIILHGYLVGERENRMKVLWENDVLDKFMGNKTQRPSVLKELWQNNFYTCVMPWVVTDATINLNLVKQFSSAQVVRCYPWIATEQKGTGGQQDKNCTCR